MNEFVLWIITFIIIFLFYFIFVILRKSKLEKFNDNLYVNYLKNLYKLDINRIGIKKIVYIIALANSFIISTTILAISIVDNNILKLVIAFFVVALFTIIIYHIIGKLLSKKYGRK